MRGKNKNYEGGAGVNSSFCREKIIFLLTFRELQVVQMGFVQWGRMGPVRHGNFHWGNQPGIVHWDKIFAIQQWSPFTSLFWQDSDWVKVSACHGLWFPDKIRMLSAKKFGLKKFKTSIVKYLTLLLRSYKEFHFSLEKIPIFRGKMWIEKSYNQFGGM